MDSYGADMSHGSSPKRIKLDIGSSISSGLCGEDRFSSVSSPIQAPNDPSEGISGDCDSGYEASSTMESMPTPSCQLSSSPYSTPGGGDRCDFALLPVITDSSLTASTVDSDLLTDLAVHAAANDDGNAVMNEGVVTVEGKSSAEDDIDEQELCDDDDDNASTVSKLSGLSDLSVHDGKVMLDSQTWIQKQKADGVDPRELLSQLGISYEPHNLALNDDKLWKIIIKILAEPPTRHKLRHINTIYDVVRLLRGARNIIVLTGAGVSVSCGIPDFRSRDGIYSRLAIDFPDLPDPHSMFDIHYFHRDPRPFFKFARDIYPGKFKPSPCHRFIKYLESRNKLLRNYTQNIDTLERVANINRVIECHGSFATATCTRCSNNVGANSIRAAILAQKIPLCGKCLPLDPPAIPIEELNDKQPEELKLLVASGIMKPDIVFFGEDLPESFHDTMNMDKNMCDLLLVIGSSLNVRPVARIPSCLPADVPQILINREPLPHCHFDVELLGDCDVIVGHLCEILGGDWLNCFTNHTSLTEAKELLPWKSSTEDLRAEEKCIKLPPAMEPLPSSTTLAPEPCEEQLKADICTCPENNTQDIINTTEEQLEKCTKCDKVRSIMSSIKERHMSIDSARDSGIGDNSNFTDFELAKFEEDPNEAVKKVDTVSAPESSPNFDGAVIGRLEDLLGYWQPKKKRSILERLPPDSFFLVPPSRYIFPGTELFYDPDEKIRNIDKSSSSESSDNSDSDDPAI